MFIVESERICLLLNATPIFQDTDSRFGIFLEMQKDREFEDFLRAMHLFAPQFISGVQKDARTSCEWTPCVRLSLFITCKSCVSGH